MPDTTPDPQAPLSQRPTVDLHDDGPRDPWWRWIIDRNPMFLVSGVFMLAGCFLVSRHIHAVDPAEVGESKLVFMLVGLLVVLNVYEFAVIGLGLALAKTRTLVRDARHLLGLALLLLIDAAFVYTESGIASPGVGVAIAAVATLLGVGKVGLVLRSLRIHASWPALAVATLALGAMYGSPVVVRSIASDGFLTQPQAMAVWCGLGVVVALYAVPLRWVKFGVAYSADHRQLQRLVAGGLIVLPVVSLIGHAAAALWVYENAFEPAMLSPVLLGLAAVMLRHHRALGGGRPTAHAATLVVASAVVASLMPGEALIAESSGSTWFAFSPLRGVLIVSPLLLCWGWWVSGRRLTGLCNSVLPWLAAALGHTPGAMLAHARWLYRWGYDWVLTIVPTNRLGWGALAIALAFACLAVGGVVSWLRRSRERARAVVSELLAGPA
ncbi:MAG: hypothetical protein ACE37H_07140 [Phycisphaeraceae bacterium]